MQPPMPAPRRSGSDAGSSWDAGSVVSGFVQIRRDALGALPPPGGRRSGGHLAVLVVALLAVLESDWRTGRMDPWPMVEWAGRMSMPWRRIRRAADRLVELGHADLACRPFRASSLTLHRDCWVHSRARQSERFVQIAPAALRSVAEEHDLDWKALGVLLVLVILADDRDWSVKGLTLSGLSADLGLGYRSLKAALARLAAAGLVSYVARPGRACLVTVTVGAALVVGSAGPPMRRRERRDMHRQTRQQRGPVWDLAFRLLSRFGVDLPPSTAFVQALEQVCSRLDAAVLEQRMVAMGTLAGARDPMAVLTVRARRISEDLDRRRDEDARLRARRAEQAAAEVAWRSREREDWERQMGEDRWLAQVLDSEQLEAFMAAYQQTASPIMPVAAVAAAIRTAARQAVADHPGEDPRSVVRSLRDISVGRPAGADDAGPGASGGVTVELPTARDGPTLTERLRSH